MKKGRVGDFKICTSLFFFLDLQTKKVSKFFDLETRQKTPVYFFIKNDKKVYPTNIS